jgi:uncharacterized protein YcfJ
MSEIPTYYDLKGSKQSRIFESEQTKNLSPDQISEAEKVYYEMVEKLEKGEEIDEGFWGAVAGGAIGALAGPAIGKALCKVLGIDEKGHLGKLLTSRLVTTAMGIALGK